MKYKKSVFFWPLLVVLMASSYLLYQQVQQKSRQGFTGVGIEQTERIPASYTLEQFEINTRATQMLEEGRQKHKAGDYASANKVLSELLSQYPYAGHREEASFLLAEGLFQTGNYQQSHQVIKRLKEHDPDSQSPYLGRSLLTEGQIYAQSGQKDKAVALYRQVIVTFPNDRELTNKAEELLMQVSF